MANTNIPIGSEVSAGTYECANCKNKYSAQSKIDLPSCVVCKDNGSGNPNPFLRGWNMLT